MAKQPFQLTEELYEKIYDFLSPQRVLPYPNKTSILSQRNRRFVKRWEHFYLDPQDNQIKVTITKGEGTTPKKAKAIADYFGHRGLVGDKPVTLRLVKPGKDVQDIMEKTYSEANGHRSVATFYDRLRREYLGIKRSDVEDFVRSQPLYQVLKPAKHSVMRPIVTGEPMEQWEMDLINFANDKHGGANHGYHYVLTVIDTNSKFAWARPLKEPNKVETHAALMDIIFQFGRPATISADNGGEFKFMEFGLKDGVVNAPPEAESKEEKVEQDELKVAPGIPFVPASSREAVVDPISKEPIRYIHSLPHHPQAQGQIERFNKTLKQAISKHLAKTGTFDWVSPLQSLVWSYNTARHSSTGMIPYSLHFRRDGAGMEAIAEIKDQVLDRLEAKADLMIANDLKHNKELLIPLDVGDQVRLSLATLRAGRQAGLKLVPIKGTVPRWSEAVFEVFHIDFMDEAHEKPVYMLAVLDEKGELVVEPVEEKRGEAGVRMKPLIFEDAGHVWFERYQLQKVHKPRVRTVPVPAEHIMLPPGKRRREAAEKSLVGSGLASHL